MTLSWTKAFLQILCLFPRFVPSPNRACWTRGPFDLPTTADVTVDFGATGFEGFLDLVDVPVGLSKDLSLLEVGVADVTVDLDSTGFEGFLDLVDVPVDLSKDFSLLEVGVGDPPFPELRDGGWRRA